ncbi:unnamed protein product [Vitrella brassicaformis CCMP3155]|uniref:Survival motor neuron Tudor domain-containing protein n=1 Tax=Vitrella brassicaformis (strain CCMP3155) TaxID=1169540 RepID=A0A0G4EUA3_VITBC|nr:unnamed protein product [Vitrella brassicaformis CCMP3155]|eukprot:CEM01670.1 unnamed protein product [Vitrella brassicaformis CCMP3155]
MSHEEGQNGPTASTASDSLAAVDDAEDPLTQAMKTLTDAYWVYPTSRPLRDLKNLPKSKRKKPTAATTDADGRQRESVSSGPPPGPLEAMHMYAPALSQQMATDQSRRENQHTTATAAPPSQEQQQQQAPELASHQPYQQSSLLAPPLVLSPALLRENPSLLAQVRAVVRQAEEGHQSDEQQEGGHAAAAAAAGGGGGVGSSASVVLDVGVSGMEGLLSSWYYAGYYTGRHAAYQEMQQAWQMQAAEQRKTDT